MRKLVLLGFLALLTIDTVQQIAVKLASNRIGAFQADGSWVLRVVNEPLVLLILACYGAAFVTYMWLLKNAPVGPAYAAVHGHIVTVLIISISFLGERLTPLQGLGCALIVAGVAVLAVTEEL